MTQTGRARMVLLLAMLVLAPLAVLAGRLCACMPAAPTPDAGWRARLRDVDTALAEGRVSRAVRAWHDARALAARSGSWEPLLAVGDAARWIGEAAPPPHAAREQARMAYLQALFRARAQESIDGVLRATEAFARLGDRDVVEGGLRIAEELAARRDAGARARVRDTAARVRGSRAAWQPAADGSL